MKVYGKPPKVLGNFELAVSEMMFYMYLPIKLKGNRTYGIHNIPKQLHVFYDLLFEANLDFIEKYGGNEDKYIYITAKHIFVTPDNPGNRPGWHCDGFGTDDILSLIHI